jgi:hypothetical protein
MNDDNDIPRHLSIACGIVLVLVVALAAVTIVAQIAIAWGRQ